MAVVVEPSPSEKLVAGLEEQVEIEVGTAQGLIQDACRLDSEGQPIHRHGGCTIRDLTRPQFQRGGQCQDQHQ